jgi:two-component system, OmpR family, sensor histidine kinase KdpD
MTAGLGRMWTWIAAIAAVAGVTAVATAAGMNPNTVGFVFLIVVLFASVWGGILLGTVISVIATLCYNFFFFPPLHTFTIEEPANWFALAAFLIASVTVSRLVVAARVQAEKAERRRMELETLYALSIDLFAATNRVRALGIAAERALRLLGSREGGLVLYDGSPIEPADVTVPVVVGGKEIGALVAQATNASVEAIESVARLIGLAIERERFMEENAHMQALRESEALKTSLLRAISHDLTTPITAITIRTESLRRRASADHDLIDDVSAIAEETSRLRRRIDNLLAMARLEAGKAEPRREPTPPADLFRAVREHLPAVFTSRTVTIRVQDDCPDVNVDPSLALEILINLVENAHRVSPAGTPIEFMARRDSDDPEKVYLEVLDRGPGLPAEASDVAQRGLGLEIARGLAAANGGTFALVPRPGGGTIARVELPAALLHMEERA